ncbi:MAG: hypothetical protein K9N06_02025 [Candidatus Cloacimonetes bacterium]|nr:hypothetical protein [Candidatus Cloacimonadota bacterium]
MQIRIGESKAENWVGIMTEQIDQYPWGRATCSNIHFILQETKCKYYGSEVPDFSQSIELDSTLAKGEILIIISHRLDRGESYYEGILLPENERVIFREKDCLTTRPFILEVNNGHIEDLGNFNKVEFQLSVYFSARRSINMRRDNVYSDYIRLHQLAGIIINALEDSKIYQIYIPQISAEKDTIVKAEGRYLKEIYEYNFEAHFKKSDLDLYFDLLKSIACNDKIPYELKDSILSRYMDNYFTFYSDTEVAAAEYLQFLLKIIDIYSHKPVDNLEIDQQAMHNARENCEIKGIISNDELFQFSQRVLTLDKNPIVNFQAWSAMTIFYLNQDKLIEAIEIADEAISKYDIEIGWKYNKIPRHLNSEPAINCLVYLIRNCDDPKEILKTIDHFYNISVSLPEFQEYLLIIRAHIIGLTDAPLEEVLRTFKEIDYTKESRFEFYGLKDYQETGYFQYKNENHLNLLQNEKREKIVLNGTYQTRKYLLSKQLELMNLTENDAIYVIQQKPLGIKMKYDPLEFDRWQKVEINGDINWIKK